MIRKILCLLAAALVCCALGAAAGEGEGGPVTAAELDALLESVRAEALAEDAPVNDPAAEDAQREDGTFFQYETAWFFAEGTVLAEDTPVNALVFEDSEGDVFRCTGIDTHVRDLLAAFPNENPDLNGTYDEALLYLEDAADGGFTFGRILRDGQRISAVEYGEAVPRDGQFRVVSITYTLYASLVSSIRIAGLNPDDGLADPALAAEIRAELEELGTHDEYAAVKTSRDGLELEPFSKDDLVFGGFSYTALRPDTLPGEPDRVLIDNEDGTWLLRCDEEGYQAVFSCDADGNNARIVSFTLLDEATEGPRRVRLGDLLSDDYSRFRSENNEMGEDMTEILYGSEDSVPRGIACFNPDDMYLRYVAEADGLQVELLLRYETNMLTEIFIHTL